MTGRPRSTVHLAVGALAVAHGAAHLLVLAATPGGPGLAGDAAPPAVGSAEGLAWLATAVLLIGAGAALIADRPTWWRTGAVAVVASQVLVVSHGDARWGTLANVVLGIAVLHGWCATGHRSARARYRRGVAAALAAADVRADADRAGAVTADDLATLPAAVARYLRRTDSVGRPPVTAVRVTLHGRIRSGPSDRWMTFTGEQVDTAGPRPTRHFLLDATAAGLPVDVLHVLTEGRATMRGDLLSVVPVLRGAGPAMDRSETVTLFNDLCLMAPSALLAAPVTWEELDARRVRGTYRQGGHSVRAVLEFDEDGDLVDFVSDDRFRATRDGRSFTRERWSTPVDGYAVHHGRRLPSAAAAMWHPSTGEPFRYAEMVLDDVAPAR
ncbi:DUF6544 family protein [Cellulomonas sp. P4]|uniref:DUF6544 family protein n=1 Tax=Cellulomonas sp. P4 TaxID=3142533 RepID=UPI0031BB55A8